MSTSARVIIEWLILYWTRSQPATNHHLIWSWMAHSLLDKKPASYKLPCYVELKIAPTYAIWLFSFNPFRHYLHKPDIVLISWGVAGDTAEPLMLYPHCCTWCQTPCTSVQRSAWPIVRLDYPREQVMGGLMIECSYNEILSVNA